MSSSTDRGLEWQLWKAAYWLNSPPSSANELLPVLDQVENVLSRVKQSLPKSMQNALLPSQNALVSSELLRHSDVDVKVAVASCISEITRITAPEVPYDDEEMKEIFQLIVSSFEELSDMSSRSYNKRTLILKTIAEVKSCLVMLDLECDTLIIEMFQHFLKSIRDNHSGNVFTSMERIMILVLEESEDISIELLTPMLASLKKDTKEFLPIAQKLAKNVFENCATKLKPHLIQVVKSLGIFLEDYNEVVSSICLEKRNSVELHNENNSCKIRVVGGTAAKAVMCNGLIQAADDGLVTGKIAASLEAKTEQISKKGGRIPNCTLNSAKPSVSSPVDSDKEAESLHTQMKIHKEGHSSPCEDSSHEAAPALRQEKETDVQTFLPKAGDCGTLSPSGTLPDQNRPRKGGQPKKRKSSIQEAKPPAGVPKRASEGTSDSGVSSRNRLGKKATGGGKAPIAAQKIKKENNLGNSEVRPLKEPGKKMNSTNSNEDGPSTKQQQKRKGQVRGKASVEKDGKKSSADNDGKVLEFREDLVGSKIKVFWPGDDEYHEGVVGSFDPVEKKHKVLYTDGDLEVLNLKDEKWKLIEDKPEGIRCTQPSQPPAQDPINTNKEHGINEMFIFNGVHVDADAGVDLDIGEELELVKGDVRKIPPAKRAKGVTSAKSRKSDSKGERRVSEIIEAINNFARIIEKRIEYKDARNEVKYAANNSSAHPSTPPFDNHSLEEAIKLLDTYNDLAPEKFMKIMQALYKRTHRVAFLTLSEKRRAIWMDFMGNQ